MQTDLVENRRLEEINFTTEHVAHEYAGCTFVNCSFREVDLGARKFVECEFLDCDLSMVGLKQTALQSVQFKGCKLLGTPFNECNAFLFEVRFERCNLQLANFDGTKLKQTLFAECTLLEADFTASDLSGTRFYKSDLSRAVFASSILEGADLRSAYNFVIDPQTNRLKGARFTLEGLPGLLARHSIVVED